jgi:hypothetical protein
MAKHEVHHHHEESAHVEHNHKRRGGESKLEREAHREHESVAEELHEEHKKRAGGGRTSTEEEAEVMKRGGHHEKHAKGGRTLETHEGMHTMSRGLELQNFGRHPGHPTDDGHPGDKKGGTAHHRRARGGKLRHEPVQAYNAQGSHEEAEAENEKPEFKRGGHHAKRKSGGHATGEHEHKRLDHKPRGGHHAKRAAGGGAPYSSGRNLEQPKEEKNTRGHESAGPA